jgi:hypothetical protein
MARLKRSERFENVWFYNCNVMQSIDASYQVLYHLAKRFQRKRFLEIDQSETRIACFSPDPLTNMATTGNSCF